jgi:2-methylcitrate dehydratase PrpD
MSGTAALRLGEWAAALRLSDVPRHVADIARRCMVDVTGVAVAGSQTASANRVLGVAAEQYAAGPCTVLGHDTELSAPGAALANGVAAHALDYDDNCYAGIVHGSATVFPAVLAAAELHDVDGEALLRGFIAGVEVEYAVGKAATRSLYDKGWFSTSVLGAIGAAAGAARTMGLDGDATSRAIALAAAGAGGVRAVLGTEGKHYLNGRAAESGVLAALLAARGTTAPVGVFEDRKGFLNAVNDGVIDQTPIDQLGQVYGLETPGVDIKRYPICYAGQAAAEAAADILTENAIAGDQVAGVICDVPPLVAANLTFERPQTPHEAQFSLQFAVAAILVFGDIGLENLTGQALRDDRLRAAFEKVEMRISDRFEGGSDHYRDCPEGAFVTVMTGDGTVFETFNCSPIGSAQKPMPRADLEAKFMACAGRAVASERASRWLARLNAMESIPAVRSLFAD